MIKFTQDKNWKAPSPHDFHLEGLNIETLTQKILMLFEADDCIFGLFSALVHTDRRVSPFIATRNYCMRLETISSEGILTINASPIYYLGPEYPNEYEEKHGIELEKEAIVGLIELPPAQGTDQAHKTFSLGIDAGIVFKDSKIAHNQKLKLSLKKLEEGMFATLSCDSQTTSKMFTWEQLEILEEKKPLLPTSATA